MKKTLAKLLFVTAILLTITTSSYATLITVNFDGSGNLQDSVFGFQANCTLTDSDGNAVSVLDPAFLTAHYQQRFNGSAVETASGAIPGIDMSLLNINPTTNWTVEPLAASVGVLGYTLGTDPLVTGVLFSLEIPDDWTMTINNWILSDSTGDPDTFRPDQTFVVIKNGNTYDITPSRVVPIPAAVWLLGSGLLGLWGIRRRRR